MGNIFQKITQSRWFISALIGASVMGTVYFGVSYVYGEQYTESWETIELLPIEDIEGTTVYPFEGDIQYRFYLQSIHKTRAARLREMGAIYNAEIAKLWRLIDADRRYMVDGQELVNVASLNAMGWPTDWIEVDPLLLSLLQHAYQVMEMTDGHFNLFGGMLHHYWNDRFYDQFPQLIDPTSDVDAATQLADIVATLSSVMVEDAIEFDNVDSRLRINIAKTENLQLNLQYFEQAYALDVLQSVFVEDEVEDIGFFVAQDGYISTRGQNPTAYQGFWSFQVLLPESGTPQVVSEVSLPGPESRIQLTWTDVRHPLHYRYNDEGLVTPLTHVRHPYYSARSGYPIEEYRQLTMVGKNQIRDYLAVAIALWTHERSSWSTTLSALQSSMLYASMVLDINQNVLDPEFELYYFGGEGMTIDHSIELPMIPMVSDWINNLKE